MQILLLLTSISSVVLYNCLSNHVCKKRLSGPRQIQAYNIIVYSVCLLAFGALLLGGGMSLYTLLSGLLFGVVTALSAYYKMRALGSGPMHITLLLTTSSMIIPTLSGVFFGESFSAGKLSMVFVLLFFIYLSLDRTDGTGVNRRWFLFCIPAFLLQGAIGVLQKIHQTSAYREEVSGFLFTAFACSFAWSWLRAGRGVKTILPRGMTLAAAVTCGACTFAMNYINLRLSGVIPSQLFFPLINGSAIIASSLVSVTLFRETLTRRQLVGLVGGIAALIAICLVP